MRKNNFSRLFSFSFLFLTILSALTFAKSYYIQNADIVVDINKDGSFNVSESLTFSFSGCFTYAFRKIPSENSYENTIFIEGVSVSVEGVNSFTTTLDSGYQNIRWEYNACDESKTFLITYQVKGQILKYEDVADFYWKFWGEEWEVSASKVTARVKLPELNKQEQAFGVYAWAHRDAGVESNN